MRLSKQVKRLGSCLKLLAVTIGLGTGIVYAQPQSTTQEQKFFRNEKNGVPNLYFVKLKPGFRGLRGTPEDEADSREKIKAVAADLIRLASKGVMSTIIPGSGVYIRELPEDAAIKISHDYRVESVDQDSWIKLLAQKESFDPATCANGTPPVCNWGLDRMDQNSLPLDNGYTYNLKGTGVNIYVVDSGIFAGHNAFAGGRVVLAYDRFSGSNGVPSDNANQADCSKDDSGRLIGHGTGVASIAGGIGVGVAEDAKLHSVRVFSCPLAIATTDDVVAGLQWVKANAIKPAVVNLSLSSTSATSLNKERLDMAVIDLINSGIAVVVGAGNDNVNAEQESPARIRQAITVSGSSIKDARGALPNGTLFNFGSILDLFAAGEAVLTASANAANEYLSTSGTSYAAPQVAGAVAMFLEKNRNAIPETIEKFFVAQSTKDKLTNIGEGSPNRLLYVPIIKIVRDIDRDKTVDESYGCNVLNASDRNTYWTTRLSTTGAPDPVVPTFGEYYYGIWDRLVPADYDGDGIMDRAVYRASDYAFDPYGDGVWYFQLSTNPVPGSYTSYLRYGDPYGNDMPMPGDYDGDGKADPAIWRRNTGEWFINYSTGSGPFPYGYRFGVNGDKPIIGDYDGDSKDDIAVWRPDSGVWYILQSSTLTTRSQAYGLGLAPYLDLPVAGDYDGDGVQDLGIFRQSTGDWFTQGSWDNQTTTQRYGLGVAPYYDEPIQADYDADGRFDLAVSRELDGNSFILGTSDNQTRIGNPLPYWNYGCIDNFFLALAYALYSPIVIDTAGNGYDLSRAEQGVNFDLTGSGHRAPSAWTKTNSDDAFLVLDRNGNGRIDGGKELFGDATDQQQRTPKKPTPGVMQTYPNWLKPQGPTGEPGGLNGFKALAVFDKAAQGGAEDGVIDDEDSVFTQLRLWKDLNHNGVSESGELFTLPALGVAGIGLNYEVSRKVDRYGNEFRYRGRVYRTAGSQVQPVAYDVFLKGY